jgi:adenine-specific DNA-methyltransferase
MELNYPNKASKKDVLSITSASLVDEWTECTNKLLIGENFSVMKSMLDNHEMKGKIDLVYIDPPFASDNVFTMSDDHVGTMSNDRDAKVAYTDTLVGADFLEFMRIRLLLIKELMSPTASIYVHTDYKIGHYLKIIMDEVFGEDNFRNDISRVKCNPKNFKRKCYGNIKDMVLFYTKGKKYTWNESSEPYSESDIKTLFNKVDVDGRVYTTSPIHAPGVRNGPTGNKWRDMSPPKGRHWSTDPKTLEQWDQDGLIEWSKKGVPRKIMYADASDGKKRQDIWEFKDVMHPVYPTEKNPSLLDTIISASSNEGDIVLDCFSGSGTTLKSAHELNRKWIGIERSDTAVPVIMDKMSDSEFEVIKKAS